MHKGVMTPAKRALNAVMSKLRIVVEWGFGIEKGNFKYHEFWVSQRVAASPVGTGYRVSVLLNNLHVIKYGSNVAIQEYSLPVSSW
jgi:hypothetical protein